MRGSPHENLPKIDIFEGVKRAISLKRYSDITYNDKILKNVKLLRIIYCKGNWQVAMLSDAFMENNGYGVVRLSFITKIKIQSKTFYIEDYTKNFIDNFETFGDGYKKNIYDCKVVVSPKIEKYFLQKKFFRSQTMGEKLKNSWRIVNFRITSDSMILLLARRFYPDFIILSPKSAKDAFDEEFLAYKKNDLEVKKTLKNSGIDIN
ncbi:MAG: WYL domain-containing protein [Campylobacteraceae bacterium]